ncbi:hypothetical protein KHQ08_13840 [Pseudochrobactrum algeriensis]|uniref:hypothetical protein n=1 Tax=Pseudochrobactrum algeriensis TaxID=2834768 RepID=UPI001BCF8CEC|nr:hypothetical protein [Pseudochrobactrum algeriensis]MBX8812863.1 hypothetical protein [Ochrobactrum sp. MR34]QVQ36231.1 hypothetical protein KHQ08_13840 [Pseudochrobactrum algeriensis]QVQ39448.1 hypothetical protein KHQ07_12120 [Pseudochrobactrum algeriensis]QVQ43368.1 hypothetical protein KHQ09_14080 [Pseudochrobactrum algeriensis]
MKKIALTVAALALTAGAAFAENPNAGIPDNLYGADQTFVTANATVTSTQTETYSDGSANGFDDHSPASTRR